MRKTSTVLVVEDEEPMRELLRFNLRAEGYRVLAAGSAERGLSLVESGDPDLIVLDVRLPGMDGFEMCRQVRLRRDTPILFLTSKKDEIDKLLGLKLGGDDYVTKPFSLRELLARVEALGRRAQSPSRSKPRLLSAGGVSIDLDSRAVSVRGKTVSLSPKEFELLSLLIRADGRILSREHLMKKVWGYRPALGLVTRTLDQHIALLRKKLRPEQAAIQTISKGGYRIRAQKAARAGPGGR